jgi:hypothetical protein
MKFELSEDKMSLGTASLTNMTREEVATIWYALQEYAEHLEDDFDTSVGANADTVHEDRAFVYGTLAKVHALMFEIKENHDGFKKQLVQSWLDV